MSEISTYLSDPKEVARFGSRIDWAKFPTNKNLQGTDKAKIAFILYPMAQRAEVNGREAQIDALKQIIAGLKSLDISSFTTAEMEKLVIEFGFASLWRRNPDAQDQLGLRRSIGDALGGHGLGLKFVILDDIKHYLVP